MASTIAADDGWIRVSGEHPAPPIVPVDRRRVLTRVIATAAAVIVVVALVGVVAAQRLAEAEAITDAAATADLIADAVVQPVITDALVPTGAGDNGAGDNDAGVSDATVAAIAALDDVVTRHVLSAQIVRVKLWLPSGEIVYSDESRLIGQTFELEDEERKVLTNPQLHADISDLTSPENVYETANTKLLEVYRPVWTPSGQPLLLETYFRYTEVTERSGQLWRGFAGITLSSVLVLVVLLFPVLWRLLENLRTAQTQREELLQRALDASADERRRIAGSLHDGVVQDLAGTSYSLAAAAERAMILGDTALANDVRAAASTVRGSMGGLRSLLVDIYPPSLASAGIASALADLGASLRSHNISVEVDADPNPGVDAAGERLIFRVAQECLNNVRTHAQASIVTIRLARVDGAVQLDISDNGRGFDATAKLADPDDGHFGLRVLGDVATEAGAHLWVQAQKGRGTRWRLRM